MWLDSPCRCPIKFKKLHFPPGVKKRFFKNYISITWHSRILVFCYYPPLEDNVTLKFNIFKSHLQKDTLCQVWLKLAKWFWGFLGRFLKVVNVFSLCGYYHPLEKCMAFKFNNFWIPFTLEYSVSCLVEIGPEVLELSIVKSCPYIINLLLLSPLRKRARSFI